MHSFQMVWFVRRGVVFILFAIIRFTTHSLNYITHVTFESSCVWGVCAQSISISTECLFFSWATYTPPQQNSDFLFSLECFDWCCCCWCGCCFDGNNLKNEGTCRRQKKSRNNKNTSNSNYWDSTQKNKIKINFLAAMYFLGSYVCTNSTNARTFTVKFNFTANECTHEGLDAFIWLCARFSTMV